MITKVVNENIEVHTVPLEKIYISDIDLKIEFDDNKKNRLRITFKPYQAFKVITIDCVSAQEYINERNFKNGRFTRYMLEIVHSQWIEELKRETNSSSTFLEKSHHYFLILGNNVVEIISYENYVIEWISNDGK